MATNVTRSIPSENIKMHKRSGNLSSRAYKFISKNFLYRLSWFIIFFIIFCSITPNLIATHSPLEMNQSATLQSPSWEYLLGTDQFGRDIFSLIVYGSRHSLIIGLTSVVIGGVIGIGIGLLAGYGNQTIDGILMRGIEMLMSIPGILLAIILSSVLEPSLWSISIAVGVAAIPSYARVVRGQVISVKSAKFIEAAKAIGTSHFSIIFKHILPNCFAPIIVMATIGVGNAILLATALSFLGLGVVSEIPDWGYLLSQGRDYLSIAWWISVFPGLAITFLVISTNIIGERWRDLLNPKTIE